MWDFQYPPFLQGLIQASRGFSLQQLLKMSHFSLFFRERTWNINWNFIDFVEFSLNFKVAEHTLAPFFLYGPLQKGGYKFDHACLTSIFSEIEWYANENCKFKLKFNPKFCIFSKQIENFEVSICASIVDFLKIFFTSSEISSSYNFG